MQRVGCRPPYWKEQHGLENCASKQQLIDLGKEYNFIQLVSITFFLDYWNTMWRMVVAWSSLRIGLQRCEDSIKGTGSPERLSLVDM
jgi:hypothetical protein